ncbi:MAG: alpha/beta fold hydrolase [Pseudomonadota bacterium]
MKRLSSKKFLNGHIVHFTVDGNGPWLVLIHSLATDLTVWAPHIKHLAKRFRVLRYDIRGHGKSGNYAPLNADSYSLELLAGDLLALLDDLGIQSAHLVGISLGSMIGQVFALNHPGRLESLTLISSANSRAQRALQRWDEKILAATDKGLDGLVDGFLQAWFTPGFRHRHPEPISRISRLIKSTDRLGFIRACRTIRDADLTTTLEKIKVPALLIVGKEDAVPYAIEKTMTRLNGAEFVTLPGAAQWAPLEQAGAFLHCLDSFLKRSSPAASN